MRASSGVTQGPPVDRSGRAACPRPRRLTSRPYLILQPGVCRSPQPETPGELTRRASPPRQSCRARADSLRQSVGATFGGRLSSCGPPSIKRLATATHSSQMKTRGPATSFETSSSFFPQKEQRSCLSLNILLPSKGGGTFLGEKDYTPAGKKGLSAGPAAVRTARGPQSGPRGGQTEAPFRRCP